MCPYRIQDPACFVLSAFSEREMSDASEVLGQPSRTWGSTLKWVGLISIIFAAGAVVAGATYQSVGTRRDAHRFPQRGRSVQAGAVKLNLDCSGQHSSERAEVILDSGVGVPAVGWIKVQPEVAGKPYPPDPLLTREQMDEEDNLWINALQRQEAGLSTRGKQIIVWDSGHMIPFRRPDAVVGAIHEVWNDVTE